MLYQYHLGRVISLVYHATCTVKPRETEETEETSDFTSKSLKCMYSSYAILGVDWSKTNKPVNCFERPNTTFIDTCTCISHIYIVSLHQEGSV